MFVFILNNKFVYIKFIVYICIMRKSKRIELSKECIKTLTIEAAKNGTTFKPMVEDHIEKLAIKISKKK